MRRHMSQAAEDVLRAIEAAGRIHTQAVEAANREYGEAIAAAVEGFFVGCEARWRRGLT